MSASIVLAVAPAVPAARLSKAASGAVGATAVRRDAPHGGSGLAGCQSI